jgi:hypothetical protein
MRFDILATISLMALSAAAAPLTQEFAARGEGIRHPAITLDTGHH